LWQCPADIDIHSVTNTHDHMNWWTAVAGALRATFRAQEILGHGRATVQRATTLTRTSEGASREVEESSVSEADCTLRPVRRESRRIDRRLLLQRATTLGGAAIAAGVPGGQAAGTRSTRRAIISRQEPRAGGTLREGSDRDIAPLDPLLASCCDPSILALYESLLTTNRDGDLEAGLAEGWDADDDARTLTLTIREDARFQTGRLVDAMAIRETIETLLDPATGSSMASLLAPIANIDTPDSHTVRLTLNYPSYALLTALSSGAGAIVNMATRTEFGNDYGRQVVDGTGPFGFEEWVPESHISVRRWEGYPGSIVPSLQNKGKAYLDRIRWEPIANPAERIARIETGEIDTLRGAALADLGRLQENPNLTVLTFNEPSAYLLGLNFERTDLDFHDLRMRQAISGAIDRPALVRELLFNQGEPLSGPVSTADPAYTADVERFNHLNDDATTQSLTALGWAVGADRSRVKGDRELSFTVLTSDDPLMTALGAALRRQLRSVGIDLQLEPVTPEAFLIKVGAGVDAYLQYDSWQGPAGAIVSALDSRNASGRNWAQATVPPVDDAIRAWQRAATRDEFTRAGQQYGRAVAEHLPVIPLFNRHAIWVHRTNIYGWAPDRYGMAPRYNDVWIDDGLA
jgi:peptide/nickel transport system substrate-binding protein